MEQAYGRPLMASFYASFSLGGLAGAVLGGLLAWLGAGRAEALAITVAATAIVLIAGRSLLGEPAGPGGRVTAEPRTAGRGLRSRRPPGTRCRVRPWRGEGPGWRGPGSSRLMALGLLALCSPDRRGCGGQLERALPAGQPGCPAGNPGRRIRGLLPRDGGRAAGRRPARRPVRPGGHGPQVRPAGLGRAGCGVTQPRLGSARSSGSPSAAAGFSCVIPQLFSAAGRVDPDRPGERHRPGGGPWLPRPGRRPGADRRLREPGRPAGRAGHGGRARALRRSVRAGPGPAAESHASPGGSAERILPHRPDHDLADVHRGGLADGVHDGRRDVGRAPASGRPGAPRRAARRRSARAGSG